MSTAEAVDEIPTKEPAPLEEPETVTEEPETPAKPDEPEVAPEQDEADEAETPEQPEQPAGEVAEFGPGWVAKRWAKERCDETTSAGGTTYRCSLDAGHEDEHSFQAVEATDTGGAPDPSLEAFEKSMKKIGGYRDRYVKTLQEEMGDEFEHVTACPLCPEETPGFFFPAQVLTMSDEQRIAVRLAIGDAELPSYQPDAHRHVCETCGGWGRVLTGSKRAQQDVLDCLDCGGKGYRSDQAARALAQQQPEGEIVSGPWIVPDNAPEAEAPDTDPWGTPPGAPYYGVMLHFRPEGWEQEVAQFKAANGLD